MKTVILAIILIAVAVIGFVFARRIGTIADDVRSNMPWVDKDS